MTTDTTDLREKIARALHDQDQENAAASGVMTDGDAPEIWAWAREWADAVLPIVQAAQAEAIREAADALPAYPTSGYTIRRLLLEYADKAERSTDDE